MSISSANPTILDGGPANNLLGANNDEPKTSSDRSRAHGESLKPESKSTELQKARDTCREPEPTPGEVHAAYLQLNGQITAKLDAYVTQAVKAKDELEAMLPLVDHMQSMLSQRGSRRKLMDTLGLPTWSEWFEDFRKRLHEDITIRTIQRHLRKYRGDAPEKDVNVIAKESVRHVESKKQLEKLESAVKKHKQLNPAIRSELIRALKARAKAYLLLAEKLEKGAGR